MDNKENVMNESKEQKFVDVPIQVMGESKQKKHVMLGEVGFNPKWGNLFIHLDDKNTILLKKSFLEKYINVGIKEASEVERSVKNAPVFKGKEPVESTARLKVLGERDGRTFLGPTGSVKYEAAYKGLSINLDSQHVMIVDGKTLSRGLGVRLTPLSMDRGRGGMSL